jgi:hypothetical protein
MIMHTEKRNNTQKNARPPLPPAAVFDAQHMAEARPVQPLGGQRAVALKHRRFAKIAPMIAGVIVCIGIGAASVDFAPDAQSTKDDTAQAASESLAPSVAIPGSMEPAVRRPTQKRRTLSTPQARETLPPVEFSEDGDNRKPRARMVSVIH